MAQAVPASVPRASSAESARPERGPLVNRSSIRVAVPASVPRASSADSAGPERLGGHSFAVPGFYVDCYAASSSLYSCSGPWRPEQAPEPDGGCQWEREVSTSLVKGNWNPHWIRVAEEDEAMKIGPCVARKRQAFWEARFAVAVANCNASMISRSQHITD